MLVTLDTIRIETPRLIIREYRPDDLASIHDYASQPLVVRYQEWGPNRLEETEQFLQQTQQSRTQQPRFRYELSIERNADGRQIGGCELAIDETDTGIGMIGYVLNPLFWGQGYATESTKALVHFGFAQLKLTAIRATCDSRNSASVRVLEKCGFALEYTIPNDFIQKGELRTTQVFRYMHQPPEKQKPFGRL